MQKQAPTFARLLVMVTFALSCFGLLLFLWLAFGGPVPLQPKGYRIHTSFGEATQLSQEADVRISGVSVGKVKTIVTDVGSGRSDATIELESRYAPLPRDTRATLRQKTLLGETYVELTPGSRKAGAIPEDGELAAAQVSPTVELDEIFRAFDPKTRREFQAWMQNMAVATKGRGRDVSDTLGSLGPFAEDTNKLLKILNAQEGSVQALARDTGTVFEALSEQQGQLSGLISSSNRVFAATAQRNQELQDTFSALPAFEREAKQTVDRLTAFAQNADPLTTQLRPAVRELSPTLADLSSLAPDLEGLFTDLGPLIEASQRGLPATEKLLDELRPALAELDPTLAQLNPILAFLGRYKAELNAFFANTTAATQAYKTVGDEQVHYLRTTNPLNLESLALYAQRLGSNRANAYRQPGGLAPLEQGLDVYNTTACGRDNVPGAVDTAKVAALYGQTAAEVIAELVAKSSGAAVAGELPCRPQDAFEVGGTQTRFPQVTEERDPATPSAGK